ncbi:SLC13 family permease [Pyrococcus sp. ST04]|uniref:SLC13 family permease n=1 Tax=Pyrococcus sp. ST04 TaxID=1183377 RepID=UPI0002605E17|nr:SLC13 family permease [Pyrococcus sp. ST04]AFK23147.1 hypothetical protein Py04_1576 [Pyrococcus sp. ST04]
MNVKELIKREWFLFILVTIWLVLPFFGFSFKVLLSFIDWKSVLLIISLIMASKGIELSGAFTNLAIYIVHFSKGSFRRLYFLLVVSVLLSSPIIMNDTAMLVFIPLAVTLARIFPIDLSKLVIVLTISANVGSSLTPVGNPQNVIIWKFYQIPFLDFIRIMLPYMILWMLPLLAIVIPEKGRIEVVEIPMVAVNKRLFVLSTTLLGMNILLSKFNLEVYAFILTLFSYLALGREVLFAFDIFLALTFVFIFMDFGALSALLPVPKPKGFLQSFLLSLGLSQLVSNVPATVMLVGSLDPIPLLLGVNLGGNGIVIGSLANLIAVRIGNISMRDFHRYSIPYLIVAFILTVLYTAIFHGHL